MAEQLKLFEDILPLNGTKEKRDLTEKKMVKETKPYYLHNPKTNTLDNVNAPDPEKDMKSWVNKTTKLNEQNKTLDYIDKVQKIYGDQDPETQKLMKTAIQHSSEKHPPLRKETISERTERYLWLYDEGEKPKHYDDPLVQKVDTFQGFAEAMPLKKENNIIKKKTPTPPKKFNNMDKSTYPSNPKVRANLSTWDLMIATANTPKEKGEIRRVLYDEYRRNGITNLSDSEQKMISKGKYQTYPKVIMPKVDPYVAPVITKPSLPIEEIIRRKAQQRLHEEQDAYDRKNGTAGIVNLMRPE
tara:strand:- start:40 stop:939 length:900 start_codon:yes stop_codon:yes gene_type:complete